MNKYRCPSTGSSPSRRTAPASESNEPRMSSGSMATNTRTVGGKLNTSATSPRLGEASPHGNRHRTRPRPSRSASSTAPRSARSARPRPRRASARSARPVSAACAAIDHDVRRSTRETDSRATRSASGHQRHAHAPTSRCARLPRGPRRGMRERRARFRSSAVSPPATSVKVGRLARARTEIILVSLMGHVPPDERNTTRRTPSLRHASRRLSVAWTFPVTSATTFSSDVSWVVVQAA